MKFTTFSTLQVDQIKYFQDDSNNILAFMTLGPWIINECVHQTVRRPLPFRLIVCQLQIGRLYYVLDYGIVV